MATACRVYPSRVTRWEVVSFARTIRTALAAHFRKYVGSIVEVEAQWSFEGDPKTDAPVAIGKVYKIGREKVNDPCALGKIGFLAGMTMVANGADPGATVEMLTPGCNTEGGGDEQ